MFDSSEKFELALVNFKDPETGQVVERELTLTVNAEQINSSDPEKLVPDCSLMIS